MSTHSLCFGAKIRKICIPLHTPVLLYKSGVQGGLHYTDTDAGSMHNFPGETGDKDAMMRLETMLCHMC